MISAGRVKKLNNQCPPRTVTNPAVNGDRRVWCKKNKVSGEACRNLIKACMPEETRLVRHLIFKSDMHEVMKQAQNTIKSHGIVWGAVFFLVGTFAAAIDAARYTPSRFIIRYSTTLHSPSGVVITYDGTTRTGASIYVSDDVTGKIEAVAIP
jgi:hypothetical protein